MNFEEKLEALRSDVTQIMEHLNLQSDYVGLAEVAQDIERCKQRAEIISHLVDPN
jgi:hypothetical protein